MLIAILTSQASTRAVEAHESVEVLANAGIVSDRYATGTGFYSGMIAWDAHVTLIEQEPFDALAADHGVAIDPRELRRNLVTRGVDLDSLIGRRFRVGDQVVLQGRKAWPPCAHIVRTSGKPEIFKYLARRCGIGADVLVGGFIRVGDPIVIEDDAESIRG